MFTQDTFFDQELKLAAKMLNLLKSMEQSHSKM